MQGIMLLLKLVILVMTHESVRIQRLVHTMPKSLVQDVDYYMKEYKLMNYRFFVFGGEGRGGGEMREPLKLFPRMMVPVSGHSLIVAITQFKNSLADKQHCALWSRLPRTARSWCMFAELFVPHSSTRRSVYCIFAHGMVTAMSTGLNQRPSQVMA